MSAVGAGTTFKLTIPARLSHERALVFRYQEALFAIPARQILDVFRVGEQKVRRVVGGLAMWSRQGVLPLVSMAVALGIPAAQVDSTPEPLAIVVATSDAKWAFSIADVVGEFELLRKPADPLVSACAGCVASATLDDGRLVLYLNPATLLERARRTGQVSPQLLNRVQKRVLLVDDSAIIRQLAALVLGSGGLLVSMAANGRAALALCEQQLPDLVISDLDMPEMDGLALLTRLRARWPALPVIIFSNHESPEYKQQAQALGEQLSGKTVRIAQKAGVDLTEVKDIFIYGNHSPTMFPAFAHATIGGKPASEVINDKAWLEGPFCETVGKRGAAIIAARGASSAASAANALVDHVRSLVTPGAIHSIAVKSNGLYGFDPEVWAGMPVRTTTPGSYEVITGYEMDDFAKSKIAATNKELVDERGFVAEML